jgi:hypothetical protein
VRVLAGTDVVGTIFLGIHPEGDIATYDDNPLQDPGVLACPAAVVVRGVRLRLSLRKRHYGWATPARGRI